MARVFVDVGVFGEKWFGDCSEELLKANNVRFSYAQVSIFQREHERTLKAAQFYKIAFDMGKRDDANREIMKERIDYLKGLTEWRDERSCDDPHIFALSYEKSFSYLFTSDSRISSCRNCMRRVVDHRFCKFSLIQSESSYKKNKGKIFS